MSDGRLRARADPANPCRSWEAQSAQADFVPCRSPGFQPGGDGGLRGACDAQRRFSTIVLQSAGVVRRRWCFPPPPAPGSLAPCETNPHAGNRAATPPWITVTSTLQVPGFLRAATTAWPAGSHPHSAPPLATREPTSPSTPQFSPTRWKLRTSCARRRSARAHLPAARAHLLRVARSLVPGVGPGTFYAYRVNGPYDSWGRGSAATPSSSGGPLRPARSPGPGEARRRTPSPTPSTARRRLGDGWTSTNFWGVPKGWWSTTASTGTGDERPNIPWD